MSHFRSEVKSLPDQATKAFFQACGALVGLTVSDNLLGFTKLGYSNEITVGIATVAVIIGVFSRNRGWGSAWRRMVRKSLFWMFGAMGLIVLGVGAEKQLGVFSGPTLSIFNVWVAFFLFLAIVITVPFFGAADWVEREDKFGKSLEEKRKRVPTIFNSDFIVEGID